METFRTGLRRTTLGVLVAVQILFYPAFAFADTAAPATDPTQPTSDTTTTPVTEAAPAPTTPEPAPATADPTPTTPSPTPSADTPTSAQDPTTVDDSTNKLAPSSTPAHNSDSPAVSDTSSTTANNAVDSTATTGDAKVHDNSTAGSAATGTATAVANLLNLLQSHSNVLGNSNLTTFSKDIYGDVVGDLVIDPGALAAVQNTVRDGSEVQVTHNAAVNNDVNLNATSGNATVADNNHAGDATTGNARTMANIVNLVNSSVAANGSFFGMVNIYGNLQGDILMPPGFIDSLVGDNNTLPTATISVPNSTLSNTANIANNVSANAASGNATVADNNEAGSATTGNATTNITVLNLTGQQVIGANTLLVFVNVQGKWVGMIVNAPGNNTAALGGGITANSVNGGSFDSTSNQQITNNVAVNARSGDAAVRDNNHAGNARSGDASASVNIANIANSSFSLSNWFGILFINVFGSWEGSFGIDTAMGGSSTPPAGSGTESGTPAVQVFQFVPGGSTSKQTFRLTSSHLPTTGSRINGFQASTSQSTNSQPDSSGVVLSTTTTSAQPNPLHDAAVSGLPTWMAYVAAVVVSLILLGFERLYTLYQAHRRNRNLV